MQQTCRGLARSFEHETYRALSVSANRKGIITDGIDTVSKLTGYKSGDVRDAIDTLLDADLIERKAPGVYEIFSPCKCQLKDIFTDPPIVEHAFDERRGSMMPGGHLATEPYQPIGSAVSDSNSNSQGLSRSLPKNGLGRNSSVSAQISGLVFYFKTQCDQAAISPRGWNAAALRANLNRWNKEGLSVEVLRKMVDLFVDGDTRFGPRSVAWKLFAYQRESLQERAGLRLPAVPDDVDTAVALMRRGRDRMQALAAR